VLALALTAWLSFAQDTPPEAPPEAPPPPSLGLAASDAIEMGDEMRAKGAGYAALIAYTEALAADPKKGGERLQAMIYLSTEFTGDEELVATALYHYGVPESDDADVRGVALHLLAREQTRRGEYVEALATLKQVKAGSKGHADAEALRGVILNQQGTPRGAIAAFLTARGAGEQLEKGPLFDDAMDLNLARTYYASKGFAKAIEFYALVDRESPWWPEATFERAWAHFMLDDMTGTLALLSNLNSPFFEDWYFPEADMLRGQTLFLMCRFPAASAEIESFTERYTPIKEQLDRALGSTDAAAAFDEVETFERGNPTKIPGAILRSFTYEERFKHAQKALRLVDMEMSRIATDVPGETGDLGLVLLDDRKKALKQLEGARVLAKARAARAEIDQRLQNVKITKLDIMGFEQRAFERAAVTGSLEVAEQNEALRKESRRKGYRYWPFEGEYWADELGNYRFTTKPNCPADLAVGG